MAAPLVEVVGMAALRRDVAKLTANTGPLYKALAAAGARAAEPIAAATRSALPQSTRSDATPGRLAGDVRVSATRSGAAVRMGRASIRYAGWVEFGGTRRVPHASTRPYQPQGRYMFPLAHQLAPVAERLYAQATAQAFESFRWTNVSVNPGEVHD